MKITDFSRGVLVGGLFLMTVMAPSLAMAGWDDFLGDSVIYTAGGGAQKPNILFIVDRSSATLNYAAGLPYDPGTIYSGSRNPWDIYESDNAGDFSTVVVSNLENTFENLNCSAYPAAPLKDMLLANGTYSGAGTADSPIIKASRDACETASKGSTYATGNYLNYLESPPPNLKVAGADGRDYFLVQSHAAGAVPQPGSATPGWEDYWVYAGTTEQGETWSSSTSYTVTYGTSRTQKEIMFSALTSVIASKFNVANFGLATYGDSNKGASIFEPVRSLAFSDVSASSGVPLFFKKIPGSGDALEVATYTAGPQRSQAEAVYDAGYYLAGGASGYPYTSIKTTAKIDPTIQNHCGNTHIIFLTNGLSNGDNDPNLSGVTLNADGSIDYSASADPDISQLGADTTNESNYGAGTHHLDDVAWYLYNNQQITTNIVLAFQNWDPMVARAAHNGGGLFANVYNEEEMRRALEKMIVPIIQETDTAFVAPVVPANPENRTFSGSRLYLGFFYPKQGAPWYGNLKKYGIADDGTVVDKYDNPATCPDYDINGDLVAECADLPSGAFKPTAVSYWNDCTAGDASCADGGIVEAGGVGEVLYDQAVADRKIYSYLGSNTLLTDSSNLVSKRTEIYDAMGASGTLDEKANAVDFLYGLDVWDFDEDGSTTEKRNWILGDILHSKPLVIGYNSFDYTQEETCPGSETAWSHETGGTFTGINKSVIFVGANDGMLHAFKDCDGGNLWSFVPPELLSKLTTLNTELYPGHQYFIDGTPTAYILDQNRDKIINSGDKVILLVGLRRGGGKDTLDATASRGYYYALDVTNPAAPVYLGSITASEMGETWSQPTLAKIKHGTTEKIVFFVGAGYDNNEDLRFGNTQTFPDGIDSTVDTTAITDDAYTNTSGQPKTSTGTSGPFSPRGRGIYCYEVARYTADSLFVSPTTTWSWKYTNFGALIKSITPADNSGLTFSFPSDLTVFDSDYNGYVDRIYAGDTGGRLWRFDVGNSDTSAWSSRIVFKSNVAPSEVGYSTAEKGRKIFYRPSIVIKPNYVSLVFGTGDRAHPLNLAVVDRLYMVKDYNTSTTVKTEADLMNVSAMPLGLTAAQNLTLDSGAGWYIKLPAEGEKVLAPALVFSGVAYFTTYTPSTEAEVITSCTEGNLGMSRLWAVNFRDGTAAFPDLGTPSSSESVTEADTGRAIDLGSGIPSGMVPTINEDGSSGGYIGCGAGLCKTPDTVNRLVYPLFWKQW